MVEKAQILIFSQKNIFYFGGRTEFWHLFID